MEVSDPKTTLLKHPLQKIKNLPRAYWHLSSLEFLYWFASAIGSYLTVFLQRQGFRADQIGLLYAVNSSISILSTPFWGMMADKTKSIRKILIFCILTGIILWAMVPVSFRIAPVLIYFVIFTGVFLRAPIGSLFDAFVVQRADNERVTFSHVRLWGSFSYAVMSFSLSRILPRTGVEISFYMYGIFFLPFVFMLWKTKGSDEKRFPGRRTFRSMGFGRLFRNYYFITFLVLYFLIQISMSSNGSFLPILINATGSDAARLGIIGGYSALLEIPMLFLIRPLRRRLPLPITICGGVLLLSLGTFLYSIAGSLSQIVLIQTLHGLGNGLLIGSITSYVYSLSPDGLNSTALTMCGAAAATASIIGNSAGGLLIVVLGVHRFYLVSSFVLVFALALFIVTLVIGIRVLKKPVYSTVSF